MTTTQTWRDEFARSKSLKESFNAYLIDKSIPLDERWEMFIQAPNNLVVHEPWKVHDSTWPTLGEFFNRRISWYDDFSCDRYQDINVEQIIEDLEESNRDFVLDLLKSHPNKLNDLKEQMLQVGVRSFTYDW